MRLGQKVFDICAWYIYLPIGIPGLMEVTMVDPPVWKHLGHTLVGECQIQRP